MFETFDFSSFFLGALIVLLLWWYVYYAGYIQLTNKKYKNTTAESDDETAEE